MGIGDTQELEQTLNRSVFAPAAMQGVEDGVRLRIQQLIGEILAGIDFDDVKAFTAQGRNAALAGRQADFAFGGTAAKQDCHSFI